MVGSWGMMLSLDRKFGFLSESSRMVNAAAIWKAGHILFTLGCFVFAFVAGRKFLLWDAFSDYGRVADVFIQRRHLQRGNFSFGFVIFWKEKDEDFALEKADFLFLEGVRIRAFKARGSRKHSHAGRGISMLAAEKEIEIKGYSETKVVGRSYKDVVRSQNCDAEKNQLNMVSSTTNHVEVNKNSNLAKEGCVSLNVGPKTRSDEYGDDRHGGACDVVLNSDIPFEDMKWLERCIVGRLNPYISVDYVRDTVARLKLNATVIPLNDRPFESDGDGVVNVDGGSSNACSNSEEGMKSFYLEREILEVGRTINDDSIEMVRETVSNGPTVPGCPDEMPSRPGKHVESPENALSLALGEDLLVGGGFIVENGKEVDLQNVSTRNKEFSISVGEDGYLQNLELGPKKVLEECNGHTEALMCVGPEGMEESGAKHDGQRSEEGVSRGEVVPILKDSIMIKGKDTRKFRSRKIGSVSYWEKKKKLTKKAEKKKQKKSKKITHKLREASSLSLSGGDFENRNHVLMKEAKAALEGIANDFGYADTG
ncbi:Nucleotide-binding, alpha-beta plait [Corchorus capsularis]|uniref:Nucleotide-binding, alpha-beta plait n=1 Tax=Corchorus capsularis TaxID=210143 RepID=A0A1R3J0B8_COCAP|nr:Nucleotide-binding, alpha-beta plait [Corchorus capsularis]